MKPSFLLYRILGNDLPPRHGERQTLENLRFILAHEPRFEGLRRRWVVNRIADKAREAELIELIERHGEEFLHIPFDKEEYATTFLDASDLPEFFKPMELVTGKIAENGGGHALEWIYRRKNLYAINVNGARNAAIEHGLSEADWIMPWDGGTYLTESGFAAIRSLPGQHPDARYLIVPMARLSDNRSLLEPGFAPRATDEPQVIFRHDSRDRFDESLRYGHRPKAEFLKFIGVPGPWHTWPATIWEKSRSGPLDGGRFAIGGWVARLHALATDKVEASDSKRWIARFLGLASHCSDLDLALLDPTRAVDGLHCYGRVLRLGDAGYTQEVKSIAESFLRKKPISVTEKPDVPKGASPNDYVSLRRYYHADDGVSTHLDGVVNPEAVADGRIARYDRMRFQELADAVTALALATELTGDRRFAWHGLKFVRTWFIEPDTRMNPSLRFAQLRPGAEEELSTTGVVDFRDLWAVCDALRMMRSAGVIDDDDQAALQAWFRAFLDFLAKRGAGAAFRTNNIGVLHDLVAASVSAYVGDMRTLSAILRRQSLRIHMQVGDFGTQNAEMSRATPLHYSLFGLQAMINMAWLARSAGVDVWRFAGAQHRSIPMATRFIMQNLPLFADRHDDRDRFADRMEMALRAIPPDAADYNLIVDLPRRSIADPGRLGADEGFAPWWPLLLDHGREAMAA